VWPVLGYASPTALLEQVGASPQALYVAPEYWLTLMEQVCEGEPIAPQVAELYRADGRVIQVTERLHPVGDAGADSYYYLGLITTDAIALDRT